MTESLDKTLLFNDNTGGSLNNLSPNTIFNNNAITTVPIRNNINNLLSINNDNKLIGYNYTGWLDTAQSGRVALRHVQGDTFGTVSKVPYKNAFYNNDADFQAFHLIHSEDFGQGDILYRGELYAIDDDYLNLTDMSITFAFQVITIDPNNSSYSESILVDETPSLFNIKIKNAGANNILTLDCILLDSNHISNMITKATFSYPMDDKPHFYTITLHCASADEDVVSDTKLKLYVDGVYFNEASFTNYGASPGDIHFEFVGSTKRFYFMKEEELNHGLLRDSMLSCFSIVDKCLSAEAVSLLYDYVRGYKEKVNQNFIDNMFYSPVEYYDYSIDNSNTKNLTQIVSFKTVADLNGAELKHQISTDGGATFKFSLNGVWQTVTTNCEGCYNDDTTINADIKSLNIDSENIIIRTFIINDNGVATPTIHGYELTFVYSEATTPTINKKTITFDDSSKYVYDDSLIEFNNGCARLIPNQKRDSLIYLYEFTNKDNYSCPQLDKSIEDNPCTIGKIVDSSDNNIDALIFSGPSDHPVFSTEIKDGMKGLRLNHCGASAGIFGTDGAYYHKNVTLSWWIYIEDVEYFCNNETYPQTILLGYGWLRLRIGKTTNDPDKYVITLSYTDIIPIKKNGDYVDWSKGMGSSYNRNHKTKVLNSGHILPKNKWFNITATMSLDTNLAKMYIDGEVVDSHFIANDANNVHLVDRWGRQIDENNIYNYLTDSYILVFGAGQYTRLFGSMQIRNQAFHTVPLTGYVSNVALLKEALPEEEVQEVIKNPKFIGYIYTKSQPNFYLRTPIDASDMAKIETFTVEYCDDNESESLFQISKDGGSTWLYWNGSFWNEALNNEKNTEAEINANIQYLDMDDATGFNVNTFLVSDGIHNNVIKSITITYRAKAINKSGIKYNIPIYHTTKTHGLKFKVVSEAMKSIGLKFGMYAWKYIDKLIYKGDIVYKDKDKG